VVAVALSAVMLQEPVTARVAAGAGLTLLGVFLTNSGRPGAGGDAPTHEEDST
jgi:drug/metabolite transporter (DMT)-like permease